MSQAIERYLNRVMLYANRRNAADAERLRNELHDHLLTKLEQLEAEGMPREDAVFQAIEDHGHPRTVGYGLRPAFPWLDVRTHGTARGVIAIGPKAVGVVASGGVAVGVVAFGGIACGIVSVGALAAALLFAWAAAAVVPLGLAFAGIGLGMVVAGGLVLGLWAPANVVSQGWVLLGERPDWLAMVDWPFSSFQLAWTLIGIGIVGLAIVTAGSHWFQHMEKRRLLRADPKLSE